jgi:hypothetical protein
MEKFGGRFILIYFILLFTGLAFSAFGYRFHVSGFTISGIIWILVTPFAVKSYISMGIRKWSITLLLLGAMMGFVAGMIFGESIKPMVGLIGGVMIGGIGAWLLYSLVFDIFHIVLDVIAPKLSTFILFAVFALGAFWGAVNLSNSIPRYFETTGGGMLIGGIGGAFLGILLGAKREEWQELQ